MSADALRCVKGRRVYSFHNGWCVLLLVPLPEREIIVSDAARGTAVRKCDTYAAVLQWQREGTQNAQSIGSNPMCGTIYSFKNSLLIFYKNYDIIFIES